MSEEKTTLCSLSAPLNKYDEDGTRILKKLQYTSCPVVKLDDKCCFGL